MLRVQVVAHCGCAAAYSIDSKAVKYTVGVGRTEECTEIEDSLNLDYGSCRLLDRIMAQNFS